MIGLKSLKLRNFISWGEQPTTIELDNRQQCFIAGEITGGSSDEFSQSNGAGKSSVIQAILWCLSGSTMHRKRPGANVLNYFTKGDCEVELALLDGSILRRICTRSGAIELLYSRSGQDIINETLSTTGNQQKTLNRELGFDFDIFCGSVFFNQFRQPWMEMGDQTRKKTIERIMGVDRLSVYADVVKNKKDAAESEISKFDVKASGIKTVIDSIQEQVDRTLKLAEEFVEKRTIRVAAKLKDAADYNERASSFQSIDIEKLSVKWALVSRIKDAISSVKAQLSDVESSIYEKNNEKDVIEEEHESCLDKLTAKYNGLKKNAEEENKKLIKARKSEYDKTLADLRSERSKIDGNIIGIHDRILSRETKVKFWNDKGGSVCLECEQDVCEEHTKSKIEPIEAEISELKANLNTLTQRKCKVDDNIVRTQHDYKEFEDTEAERLSETISDLNTQASKEEIGLEEKYDTTTIGDKIYALNKQKKQYEATIENAEEKLANGIPDKTIKEAEAENDRLNLLLQQAAKSREDAENIETEQNPHNSDELQRKLKEKQEEYNAIFKQREKYDIIYKHLLYIYKAYSDRRRIKSFMISRHRPYFNSRLTHYLDSLGLGVKIQMTDSLGLDSNLWGYDFQSGGERARTNLAFMFAIFDLHTGIHGRQSNILVLDEPDHHLDEAGREMLLNIIDADLSKRFDSIFIISHTDDFRDRFPNQMVIRKIDGISRLKESR